MTGATKIWLFEERTWESNVQYKDGELRYRDLKV